MGKGTLSYNEYMCIVEQAPIMIWRANTSTECDYFNQKWLHFTGRTTEQERGLLPICASCKKIRDDKGYWNQIEVYIKEHSNANFSHGICPGCLKRLYPEFSDN